MSGIQTKNRKIKKQSLTDRTVRTTVISCLLLGIIALLVGLLVYANTMILQRVNRACDTAGHAWLSAKHGAKSVDLTREVMGIYRSLTPEQRELMNTDYEAYRTLYSSVDTEVGAGGTWDVLINLLDTFSADLDDVSVGMFDKETCTLVYTANAMSSEKAMYPGDWVPVSEHEMNKFLNWDGNGKLYELKWIKGQGWLCTAGYHIRATPNNMGETEEFLLVDLSINNVIQKMGSFALTVSLGILVATLIVVFFIRKRIKKTVAEPIDAIAAAAVAYVKAKTDGVEAESFSALDIHTGDELENLSRVMAEMEKDLTRHEDHIREITAEKERINTELNMATRIQESMLPHTFPAFPGRLDFDIYASMAPAREVGGDFYDYFLIDDDHLCLVIADVSGKGVPAALFMMVSKTILQSVAKLGNSPAEVLAKANASLYANNEEDMFVTVRLGILELSTGRLTAANAGHELPAVKQPEGSFELLHDEHGCALGAFEDTSYTEYTLTLAPGAKLFVYTDGVPEAMTAQREQFGTERLTETLNSAPDGSPETLLGAVREAVNRFVEGAEQFDDLTMLGLEYKGPQPNA